MINMTQVSRTFKPSRCSAAATSKRWRRLLGSFWNAQSLTLDVCFRLGSPITAGTWSSCIWWNEAVTQLRVFGEEAGVLASKSILRPVISVIVPFARCFVFFFCPLWDNCFILFLHFFKCFLSFFSSLSFTVACLSGSLIISFFRWTEISLSSYSRDESFCWFSSWWVK